MFLGEGKGNHEEMTVIQNIQKQTKKAKYEMKENTVEKQPL